MLSDLLTWLRSTCIHDSVCHQPPNVNILHISKQPDDHRRWESYFPFQSHTALAAFTCIKELAPRIFSSGLQASTQLLDKPATAPKDLPKAALPDLPTHLRGDFLYSAIPGGWSQGSTELAHHPPSRLRKALHPGKVRRKLKAWPFRISERSRRTRAEGQRKVRSGAAFPARDRPGVTHPPPLTPLQSSRTTSNLAPEVPN